jgi:urease accessory protein
MHFSDTSLLLRLWQLADSGFPSGGFTHSSGLEAAKYHGDARTADDVGRIALAIVRQAGYGALPFVSAAHRDVRQLPQLDALADLFLNQPVSNRASRAQGVAFLNTGVRVFPGERVDSIAEIVRAEALCGHHAPIFGAVLACLGVDADTTTRLFLYQSARSVISAGVRLGLIGVFDGQLLHPFVAREIDSTLECCRDLQPADAAQTMPILDLYQSTHDRLYSRLFQS